MLRDNTAPHRKARIIAVSAMALAVVGGLTAFASASSETQPAVVAEPHVIATGCSGFAVDAAKLFEKGGTAVLRGTFAPGDHVHLAIDLRGAGYSWETTGALGAGPSVTASFWHSLFRTSKWSISNTSTFSRENTLLSNSSKGNINGYARWELNFDVTSAGDGALTINQTSTTPPRVAIATCTSRNVS